MVSMQTRVKPARPPGRDGAATVSGLLAWTAIYRRKLLPLAVTLTIYGHHFRKTCAMKRMAPGSGATPGE